MYFWSLRLFYARIFMKLNLPSPLQKLESSFLQQSGVELWMKRDDLIHLEISGNKWRKLEMNIESALSKNVPVLTFGGAYSNHIAASAAACYSANISSIGIIRGDEFEDLNNTLKLAKKNGMKLHFVSREEYRNKELVEYHSKLEKLFGKFHLVPEGGANREGVLGAMNIRKELGHGFDVICNAAGTGTTATGILSSIEPNEKLEVFSALKGGGFLKDAILKMQESVFSSEEGKSKRENQFELIEDYHFGGFAKLKPKNDLIQFVNDFYSHYNIPLDLIYNGKMMFGIFDRIKKGVYPSGTKIVAIHCGGLQGNKGMIERFRLELDY